MLANSRECESVRRSVDPTIRRASSRPPECESVRRSAGTCGAVALCVDVSRAPASRRCVQGLIWTAALMYKVLHALNIPIHVQEVCVFTAPIFSALCSLAAYGFVREVHSGGAGLLAAAFTGLVPSYISRSVGGSYDLEGVAIFALLLVFYLFVKVRPRPARFLRRSCARADSVVASAHALSATNA